jgi:tetratricopeptide (TPR) repeat protein
VRRPRGNLHPAVLVLVPPQHGHAGDSTPLPAICTSTDALRQLWDFDDLDLTEERFRDLLATASSDTQRAEILTQLARVEGLRGEFGQGDRLLDEAEALAGSSARVRIDLERGRIRRSSGDEAGALPLFEAAFAAALDEGAAFLAADAAHMAALAAPDRQAAAAWTQRGVEVAKRSEDAVYWLGPLLNNLGWAQYDAGDHAAALESFERALEARERDPERPYEIEIARYAVAKALLALGRVDEAIVLLERAVDWAARAGKQDRWFDEALAEAYTRREEEPATS